MSAALPGHNDHHATRNRRQSSQSYTNLPSQIDRSQPYPQNRSEILLPSTTYTAATQPRARSPSLSNNLSRIDTSVTFSPNHGRGLNNPPSANPDEFYRQHPTEPDQNGAPLSGLHQEALRALNPLNSAQSRVGSNGSYSTNWSVDDPQDIALPPKVPGLKSRKASVKNLVAQINASSSTETPPVPGSIHTIPSATSANNPNTFLTSAHTSRFGTNSRTTSNPTLHLSGRSSDSIQSDSTNKAMGQTTQPRRPLFGEVLPTSTTAQAPGYGIINARRRTGSEGSPMHSPNPMFPPEQRASQFVLSPTVYNTNNQTLDHRRTKSDKPFDEPSARNVSSPGSYISSPISERRPPPTSRIPVSTRRLSGASDTSSPAPTSRSASAQDRQKPTTEQGKAQTKGHSSKQSLSIERSSPARITSPGRSVPQGAKSPSLRANIIAPPPKISPPLRSSRPRMPVSTASTTSSRARMAEKFDTMQKIHNQKKVTQRRPARPPELTDIDFVERRSRITRALTKSKEGEELKADFATGKKWQPNRSRTTSPVPNGRLRTDSALGSSRLEEEAVTQQTLYHERGQDRQNATRNALHVMQSGGVTSNGEGDIDSPTLGHDTQSFDQSNMHLQTNVSTPRDKEEPHSALTDVTAETEATQMDFEPQDEGAVDRPSILNSVLQMRERSPSASYEPHRGTADFSDRTDVESVNLIFRNTAYLDDDEAISKGYRPNLATQEPLPEIDEEHTSHRDSWTSSFPGGTEHAMDDDDASTTEQDYEDEESGYQEDDRSITSNHQNQDESYRNTMASDAYTIINVVLQQHSSSGIVDQQFADDVYQKVLATCPEAEDEGAYDSEQIQQLCLQEIVRRDETERRQITVESMHDDENATLAPVAYGNESSIQSGANAKEMSVAPNHNLLTLPSTTYGGHRHKSSLDSAEDFATTSPSIGWMRFESESPTPPNEEQSTELPTTRSGLEDAGTIENHHDGLKDADTQKEGTLMVRYQVEEDTLGPEEYGTAIIRAPSRSPPPPPKDDFPNIDKISRIRTDDSAEGVVNKPLVPHRVTSLGQAALGSPSISRPPSIRSRTEGARAEITPWEVQDPIEEVMNPESRRLKKRRHIIKELVDTEFTYQRDMRVLCDIYKQTAAAALSEEDIRMLFGNVEEVQKFARDFLSILKHKSKPSYLTDKNERKKDKKDSLDNLMHGNSSSSTLASTKIETEPSDVQKDRETRIGEAFEESLAEMESVYTEYIRNRQAANQKLEILQKSLAAQEWLKECRDNSSDITNAWNLDALLVKPVQRITKYPLLLRELIDATTEDHADLPTLRRVLNSVTDINMRINEVKKHAEMLDQVLNRKRGQSDVRAGLSKAFGRKAEKLRQHVGITDMYEDGEYDKLRIAYDNNYVQLMVVANDVQSYEKGISQWVAKMVDMAAAAEAWVDVGHTHHQQEESKLKHLAMIIRNVHNIALPDHLEHLQKKVIQPMAKTVDILQRFKDEPKGLLQKRDKRLVDYAQMKNKKDRGERIDKKTAERMDQWEALNTEAKERMRKLLRATAHLVQSCQGHLVQLQMSWMAMIQQKFSNVMGINLNKLSIEEIEKDWQVDFDYQEASALALGICNGSLMLQAANMTSFLTPGSTLVGDDSPRQMSFSSTNKRSVSLNSETSNVPSLDFSSRPSGTYAAALPESHFDRPYPYPNGRTRAASTTSGKSIRGLDSTMRSSTNNAKHTSASANFARPGTSPGLSQDAFAPPRLSIETHSPLVASFPTSQLERPVSSSTFFSATAGPSQPAASHRPRASGVFTSALPMSDSPVLERHITETPQTPSSEPRVLFTAASLYEFNIDRALREAGFPYLTYVKGEIFDVLGERGELWLAKNQDDPQEQVGWIWNKHFAKLAE